MRRWLLPLVVLLVAIGVISGIGRSLGPGTFGERAELAREHLMGVPSPTRMAEVRTVESRFAAQPLAIAAHASLGTLFLLLAATQFSRTIRRRFLGVHRWIGRLLVVAGLLLTIPAVYFGILIPAAGPAEAVIIALAAAFFVVSLINGARAIRRSDVRRHREWMTRAFAGAVGIATIRIVALAADLTLTPRGWSLPEIFILSLASGWVLTLGVAELGIARSRRILSAR